MKNSVKAEGQKVFIKDLMCFVCPVTGVFIRLIFMKRKTIFNVDIISLDDHR